MRSKKNFWVILVRSTNILFLNIKSIAYIPNTLREKTKHYLIVIDVEKVNWLYKTKK